MLGYAGWYSGGIYRTILFYVPFQQLFLIPPVLYFYIRSLLDQTFSFQRKDWLHFIPAALYLLYTFLIFIADLWFLPEVYFYKDGRDKDFEPWYQTTGFIILTMYLIASLRIYKKYKSLSYDTLSFADSVLFKWAQRFLSAFVLLIGIRGLFFILNPEWAEFGRKFWYYLSFSGLFYFISINGYFNPIQSPTSFQILEDPKTNDPLEKKPDHENLTDPIPDLERWKEQISSLMTVQKLYENPLLTITMVADRLDTHSKKVSQIINQGFRMNFNDYINTYRIESVIQKIDAGETSSQTIMGLAYDAGFNSKSTFNRAFKRLKNMTPKEYVEKS
jgi:AraC-like DNA-binding protein